MSRPTIGVLGAGMVGVSCALALQARGFAVTLIDRRAPGEETSHGNAGVIARSSLIPFNHPRLWRALPTLLKNTSNSFRYDVSYLRRNFSWGARFLANSRAATFTKTTIALDALIQHSIVEHMRLRQEAGVAHRYRDDGWIYAYRSEASFAAATWQRALWESFNVTVEAWDAAALGAHEPALTDVFAHALWVRDAMSVDAPGEVVKALAHLFAQRGGNFLRTEIPTAQLLPNGWRTAAGDFDHLVVALGPWSVAFLKALQLNVPMAFERGYHQHFSLQNDAALTRPLYDVSGGYVAAPMVGGVRLSTGVELNALEAPDHLAQLTLATTAARQALPLGEPLLSEPWRGARPTLPDSRPAIGASSIHRHLWFAFGHQHIGFSTGPGTGALLADLITGQTPCIDPTPFSPGRFKI